MPIVTDMECVPPAIEPEPEPEPVQLPASPRPITLQWQPPVAALARRPVARSARSSALEAPYSLGYRHASHMRLQLEPDSQISSTSESEFVPSTFTEFASRYRNAQATSDTEGMGPGNMHYAPPPLPSTAASTMSYQSAPATFHCETQNLYTPGSGTIHPAVMPNPGPLYTNASSQLTTGVGTSISYTNPPGGSCNPCPYPISADPYPVPLFVANGPYPEIPSTHPTNSHPVHTSVTNPAIPVYAYAANNSSYIHPANCNIDAGGGSGVYCHSYENLQVPVDNAYSNFRSSSLANALEEPKDINNVGATGADPASGSFSPRLIERMPWWPAETWNCRWEF
jgi:hypothetical protein